MTVLNHMNMFIYPVFVPLFFWSPPTEGLVLPSDQLKGQLEFHDVSFAYPTRKEAPIFQNLSLLVPAGTIMAVVGPSGSGKSTLVSLLLRLYDPDAGESDPSLSIIWWGQPLTSFYLWHSHFFSRFHHYRWSWHQRSESLLAQESDWNCKPGNELIFSLRPTHKSGRRKFTKSLWVNRTFLTLCSSCLFPRSQCFFLAL